MVRTTTAAIPAMYTHRAIVAQRGAEPGAVGAPAIAMPSKAMPPAASGAAVRPMEKSSGEAANDTR